MISAVAAILAATLTLSACSPEVSGGTGREIRSTLERLSGITLFEIDSYAQVPIIVPVRVTDFVDTYFASNATRMFVRVKNGTGEPLEFAFLHDGVMYSLRAAGYLTPADALHGQMLDLPDAQMYYEMRRRGFPFSRYQSYFIE